METSSMEQKTDIAAIFAAHRKNQKQCKRSTAEERIAHLRKLQSAILKYKDEVFRAMYDDFGKPPFETLTGEIFILLHEIEDTCKNLADWMKPIDVPVQSNPEAKAQIIYEPRGTVLIIGPWNFPFSLALSPLIGVIAAGNNAVVKPSELTPSISAVIKKLVEEVFDKEFVSVVEGGVELTTQLLKQPFDHIFFTGSPKVGKIVMEAAAKNLSSVTLELGGKSPAIIDSTADLDKAVARIMKGKTINSGQICMSPDYLLIPAALKQAFIDKAEEFVKNAYYRSGTFSYDDYVQIINERNFERLKGLFDDAVSKGTQVAFGGVFDTDARRIQPTLLTNVPVEAAIMKEEIFGPILPVFVYETLEEAVDFVAQFDKPLAYYVFSENKENIDYLLANSTSGGACINDVFLHYGELGMPFGGVNTSGIGSYHGIFGFQELSNPKGVFYQAPSAPVDTFGLPPYAGKTDIVLEQLTKQQ